MTCGLLDVGCHASAFLAPAWAFVLTWWWVAYGAAMLLLGSWMGPRLVLAILTVGIGVLVYDRVRNRADEPDYETGEPPKPVTPKKRRTLQDIFSGGH